jgi:hypothetical protein
LSEITALKAHAMDSAWDNVFERVVAADELLKLVNVDRGRYFCQGCGVPLTPAAYRETSLVRPYFSARHGDHDPRCDVADRPRFVGLAQSTDVHQSAGDGSLSSPSTLVLQDERSVADPGPQSPGRSRGERDTGIPSSTNGTQRGAIAHSSRPLCHAFVNSPHDRWQMKLYLPGLGDSTYKRAFKRISSGPPKPYTDPRIFYAAAQWNKTPLETDHIFEVALPVGEFNELNHLVRGYRVRIEWAPWSSARRLAVRTEVTATLAEARRNKQLQPFVFFMGRQDTRDLSLFHVTDHRLIYCFMAEIVYPR